LRGIIGGMSANPVSALRGPFSLDDRVIAEILQHAKPLGHREDASRLNLGFGFLYYGLARSLRPEHVVVIGSGFGFSVVCLALGLKDNAAGALTFVDPSYSMWRNGPMRTVGGVSNWDDPGEVQAHFERFGVERIVTHYKMTSEEFFSRYDEPELPAIDLAFIDGDHSFPHVREDFIGVMRNARRNSYILLHDSNLFVREAIGHSGVKRWLGVIKRDADWFEVVDFPFSSGVAVVRVLRDGPWHPGV
jgi:predicted O-methyltransferase YrrM